MNTSEVLIKTLEESNVKFIFGHPGEQILPLYDVLKNSSIKHILNRHEQGAAHAADGYARSSGNFGVCMVTAGPGALNLTMGVATAFKDSVPMLIITGDNSNSLKGTDSFQKIDIVSIFKNIVIKSFNPNNGKLAIINLKEALEILEKEPRGPIHLNLSKNVLLDENISSILDKKLIYSPKYNYEGLKLAIERLKTSKKPLIIAGSGIIWSKAINDFKLFINKNKIPITTTYHAKGIIDENNNLNLGMVGLRGTKIANYAYKNSDLILALGSRLTERTIAINQPKHGRSQDSFNMYKSKIIHVNIDKSVLKGNINIHGDVKKVLSQLNSLKIDNSFVNSLWFDKIYKNNENLQIKGINIDSTPLKPQVAIKEILNNSNNSYIVNDAGSHTTWTTLLSKPDSPGKLIFSGGMGPMGYGLPASIGVAMANTGENVILINGDGGFQMNIQELATVKENNLPIIICVLNNSQLGIIRQWQETFYENGRYEVDLENPDFISLANAYGISATLVKTKNDLKIAIENGLNLNKPYLIEIIVDEEDIPLPNTMLRTDS